MKYSSLSPAFLSTLTLLLSCASAAEVKAKTDPSSGCQTATYNAEKDAAVDMKWDGRDIRISMPPRYNPRKPSPLILAYTDRDIDIAELERGSALSDGEVNKKAIVVYLAPADGAGWLSDANFPKPENETLPPNTDMAFTSTLLTHLEKTHCVDKRRVFATGLGTGGGMVSLLACNRPLSRRVAAFAAISGAFHDDQTPSSPWSEDSCEFGRRPIPLLEIHGNRDVRYGYWPPGVEGEVAREGPVGWLGKWKGRMGCGEKIGEIRAAGWSNATYVSELVGGMLSEGVECAGGCVRVAYSCSGTTTKSAEKGKADSKPESDDDESQTEAEKREKEKVLRHTPSLTLLHYSLKEIGYGWPRLDLDPEEKIQVNGHTAYPPGDPHFDATELVLEWFYSHPLPTQNEIWRQAKELLVERGGKMVNGDEKIVEGKEDEKLVEEDVVDEGEVKLTEAEGHEKVETVEKEEKSETDAKVLMEEKEEPEHERDEL